MVVTKLSSSVHLLSPMTLHKVELNSQKVFSTTNKPLTTLLTAKHLTTFVVLDINPVISSKQSNSGSDSLHDSLHSDVKHAGGLLAEAEVCRRALIHITSFISNQIFFIYATFLLFLFIFFLYLRLRGN